MSSCITASLYPAVFIRFLIFFLVVSKMYSMLRDLSVCWSCVLQILPLAVLCLLMSHKGIMLLLLCPTQGFLFNLYVANAQTPLSFSHFLSFVSCLDRSPFQNYKFKTCILLYSFQNFISVLDPF